MQRGGRVLGGEDAVQRLVERAVSQRDVDVLGDSQQVCSVLVGVVDLPREVLGELATARQALSQLPGGPLRAATQVHSSAQKRYHRAADQQLGNHPVVVVVGCLTHLPSQSAPGSTLLHRPANG